MYFLRSYFYDYHLLDQISGIYYDYNDLTNGHISVIMMITFIYMQMIIRIPVL